MPSSTTHRVALVVLGMATIVLVLATAIVSVGVTGQGPIKAPRLSATETKLLSREETDLWLRDHQQLRRSFFGDRRSVPSSTGRGVY
jgi:hypothetical protein